MSGRNSDYANYGAVDGVSVAVLDSQFNPGEFSTLCNNISSNIYLVQSNATNLEKIQKQIGTSSDNTSLRDKIHDIHQRCNQIITSTAQHIHQMTSLARLGQKQNKHQSERLRNEFQNCVQRYSNIQKQVAQKIKSVFFRPTMARVELTSPSADWSEESDQTQILDSMAAQQQAQRQLAADLEMEHAFAIERDERVRQIEADMLDINDIFRDMLTTATEQGTLINNIDGNIERAGLDVDGGEEQLIRAASYQQKHRRKLLWLLLILFTVAIVVVIVVVLIKYT